MGRQRKRERTLTPKPYFMAQTHVDSGDEQKTMRAGFESLVFEEFQKARGYTNDRLRKFPTDEHGFFSLHGLDGCCTIKVVHHRFDSESIFKSSGVIQKLYDDESADIVVVNDFKHHSSLGIALAALGVIRYEDMIGTITTIPNPDCSPIYIGRTADIFATLILAGLIPKWSPAQEGDE